MHKASYDNMTQRKYLPLMLFLLGFGTFLFTRRSELVPTISLAIIIAPIFVLRFIRTQPTKRGIFLTLFGFILSMNLALWGLFDVSDVTVGLIWNLTRSSLLGILYFLPYLADRLIYPKFEEKGIISTLIFPVAVTGIFFLFSLEFHLMEMQSLLYLHMAIFFSNKWHPLQDYGDLYLSFPGLLQ